MASIYHRLARHLAAQPGPTHTMTFAQVAATIRDPALPPSAYRRRAWWGNESSQGAKPRRGMAGSPPAGASRTSTWPANS